MGNGAFQRQRVVGGAFSATLTRTSPLFFHFCFCLGTASAVDHGAVDHEVSGAAAPDAMAIRASLGRKAGQEGFHPDADLNGDGVVNALDAAMFRLAQRGGRAGRLQERVELPGSEASGDHRPRDAPSAERHVDVTDGIGQLVVGGGERILIEPATTVALPGQTVSVLVLIRDNTTPLVGYSLEVTAVADTGAVGSVTADVTSTNFFDARNLISACPPTICPIGAMRDPVFSMIADNGSGGVTIDTLTADFSTVLAVDGVNDALAQVFFDVPLDALGDFTIQLGSSSTLIDGNAAPVPFTFTPGTIRVLDPASIPTISEWGMIVMSLLLVAAGCIVCARTWPCNRAGWRWTSVRRR